MQHVFNTVKPEYVTGVKFSDLFPHADIIDCIRSEKQFFDATPSFIRSHQDHSPILCRILRTYFRPMFNDDEYHHLIVNTYSHYLSDAHMYAGIPGWHCDYSKRRDETERGPLEESACVRHWMLVIGSNHPPTFQFLDKYNIKIDDERLRESSWVEVSKLIDRKIRSGWHIKYVKPFEMMEFRGNELYRTVPSFDSCWRMQIKVSHYPKGHLYRPKGTQGKIREHHMVYVNYDFF